MQAIIWPLEQRFRPGRIFAPASPLPAFVQLPDVQAPLLAKIQFMLAESRMVRGSALGFGPSFQGRLPLVAPLRKTISGVTRDSTGAILGGCTVHLFRAGDDLEMDLAVSDATTGAYVFTNVGPAESYYIVAYRAGATDVAGTTVNTLTGLDA